jgi:HD superfamily phosphodiesterase
MKLVYSKIWNLAKPLYKKGRPMDVEHISWMIKEAEKIVRKEKLDESLLLPLVILHDIGYSAGEAVYFDKAKKGIHMEEGAKISKTILAKIGYPREKIKEIVYLVSVHDNWIYGDLKIYKKNKILGAFKDLDFLWMLTPKIFKRMCNKIIKEGHIYLNKDIKNPKDLLKELVREADKNGFATKSAEKLYKKYLNELKRKVE